MKLWHWWRKPSPSVIKKTYIIWCLVTSTVQKNQDKGKETEGKCYFTWGGQRAFLWGGNVWAEVWIKQVKGKKEKLRGKGLYLCSLLRNITICSQLLLSKPHSVKQSLQGSLTCSFEIPVTECMFWARHYAKWVTYLISYNPLKSIREMSWPSLYRWGNWDSWG